MLAFGPASEDEDAELVLCTGAGATAADAIVGLQSVS